MNRQMRGPEGSQMDSQGQVEVGRRELGHSWDTQAQRG